MFGGSLTSFDTMYSVASNTVILLINHTALPFGQCRCSVSVCLIADASDLRVFFSCDRR